MKKILAIGALGVIATSIAASNVFAGGFVGTGGDSDLGGGGDGVGCYGDHARIDCQGVSWLKFKFVTESGKEGESYEFVPNGNFTTNGRVSYISEGGKTIGGECAKPGVGFYHLGINIDATGKFEYAKGVATFNEYGDTEGNYRNVFNNSYLNHNKAIGNSPYIEPKFKYTYRVNGSDHWGHRASLSIKTASDYYTDKYESKGSYAQNLYKDGVKMYESASSTTSKTNIVMAYESFLNNYYKSEEEAASKAIEKGGAKVCTRSNGSWSCTEMPDDVYAFCAFPEDNPVNLKPQSSITIGSTTVTTDLSFDSKGLSKKTAAGEITVHSPNVSALGNFNYIIDKAIKTTSFKPPMYVAGEDLSSPTLYFPGSDTRISDGLSASAKTKSITLEANKSTEVCVETSSPSSISSTKTGESTLTARACIKVKYVPVTAEVDSDTIAIIDPSYLTGTKKKTIYYSHEDGAADYTKKYEDVGVKPGPMKVTWGHYLGYKNLSGVADGGVWSTTYNLQGGAVLGHKLKIDPYRNPGTTLANYKWQYYYNNGDGNGEYPSASNSHTKNIRNTGVFPGESSTISQTLKHPEKVNVVDGSKAANSSEEESKVEITLKGTDIECGLSKGEWGASEDHMMTIGVSNPRDYRWLAIQRTGSPKDKFPQATVVVGDGIDASKTGASLWLAPKDEFQILQKACFGSQIAIDAANKQSNRWTKNPWDKKTDNKNTKFTLVAPEKLKETRVFGNDSYRLNNAAWLKSTGEASLLASEIGISSFNDSQESTPTERINGNYQISTASKIVSIENFSNKSVVNRNLGERLETTFSKPNGEKVGITVNVPYNYYLDLKIVGDMDVITSADAKPKFTAEVQNKARKNMQVCSGALVSDPSKKPAVCNAYSTDTKPTTASMMVFTMDSDFSLDDLNGHANFLREGNATDKMSLELNLRGELGNFVGSIKDYKTQSSDNNKDFIQSGSKWELESSEINNLSDLPVGTKLCAAIAAYPSDSHNSEVTGDDLDAYAIDSSNQDGALVPTGQRTKISVQCRTVAKRQNMSVEGNGILTTGRVLSSEIMYGDKIFTSWSEYQITSGASSNAASGAATGYSPDKKLTGMDKNKAYFTKDDYSIADNSFLFPQSLGSMIKTDKPSAGDEANIAWNHTLNLKKDIINKYGGGDRCSAPEGADYNLSCFSRAEENVNSAMVAGLAGKPTAVIRNPDGTLRITENIAKPAGTKQLILIAKNIIINNNVSEINAWLIVDGGVFNTCNGYHINDPTDNGNNRLLTECHDWLYIKGPVIVDSASSPLELPRTFGGGSKLQDDKYVIDESSFIQRAEIFDFDPDMVRWAYEESIKDPQLSTTYVETLAPKL